MRVGQVGFGRAGRPVASVLLGAEAVRLNWVLRRSQASEHRSAQELLGVPGPEAAPITLSVSSLLHSCSAAAGRHHHRLLLALGGSLLRHGGGPPGHRGPHSRLQLSRCYARPPEEDGTADRVLWSPNITLGVSLAVLAAKIVRNRASAASQSSSSISRPRPKCPARRGRSPRS